MTRNQKKKQPKELSLEQKEKLWGQVKEMLDLSENEVKLKEYIGGLSVSERVQCLVAFMGVKEHGLDHTKEAIFATKH